MKLEHRGSKEPEKTPKDEFKDLHLNLPVLEVLSHAPMYNAILDKYEKGPRRPLLTVEEGVLSRNASAVIDCRKAKIAVREGITRSVFGVKEINLGGDEVPYWTTLGWRESYGPRLSTDSIGTIPINLKGNMWELEDLIENSINWDKPLKEGDGAWHIRIELIDPDVKNQTRPSINFAHPVSRKLSAKENPSEIINLDYFHDS
ncbi:hypothetical protein Tco_0655624 [Tanacetum coccineum]|uniref:Uncharacterized protein n=1 Tax=Tanacetum coccineum TaxID=301880 RepID=A0ABQ4X6I2_9ASTR